MAPTAAQCSAVHSQWKHADQDYFMDVFFHLLFDSHPEYQGMFKKARGAPNPAEGGWKKQYDDTKHALSKAIEMAAAGDISGLKSFLKELATRHIAYGVEQDKFQQAKAVLAVTVRQSIHGADHAAWREVLAVAIDSLVH